MLNYAKALLILSQICSGIQLSQFLEQDQFLPHRTSEVVREIIGSRSVSYNEEDTSNLARFRREAEENSGFEDQTGTPTVKSITEVVSEDSETEKPNEILVTIDHGIDEEVEEEVKTTSSIPLIVNSTVPVEATTSTTTPERPTVTNAETTGTSATTAAVATTEATTATQTPTIVSNSSVTDKKPDVTNTTAKTETETNNGITLSVSTEMTSKINQTVQNEIDPSESGLESKLNASKLNGADSEKTNSGKILTIVLVITCASMLALVTFGYGFYRYRNKDKGSYSIPSYTTGLIRSDHPL